MRNLGLDPRGGEVGIEIGFGGFLIGIGGGWAYGWVNEQERGRFG